ncbi:hypothetical protein [Ramlibacter sp.]|uniref:hypothetical protein n=1 Tax=Ramlibacter sp. TaxID=1917967 RepID=UPI003D126A54
MHPWIYLALWILVALTVAAFVSAWAAKQLRLRNVRRQQAVLMFDALERYGAWMAQQRHAPTYEGETPEAAEALDEACTLRVGWFPELATDMAELLGVHNRMLHFLAAQHALRQRDAERWLETDHDGRFLSLWRQHMVVMQTLQAKLSIMGSIAPPSGGMIAPARYMEA